MCRRVKCSGNSLYVCDLSQVDGVLLTIPTVEGKKQLYSDLDIKRTLRVRKLQETIELPSNKNFMNMINGNFILKCRVTRRDVIMTNDIFGTNPNIIKGKT